MSWRNYLNANTAQGFIGGGPLGALAAYFGGDGGAGDYRGQLGAFGSEVAGREAPQMGPAAQGDYSQFRNNQRGLVHRLEAMAAGRGPSLAQAQMQAATDRNMKGQQALAAGARGPNAALAQFQAANNAAQLGAQATQDAGMARIAEQQMALQQLGLTLHGARGADEDMNRFNAGQTNQASMANLNAQLQAMGLNDQARLSILQMLGGQVQPGMGERILAGATNMLGMATSQSGGMPQGAGGNRPPPSPLPYSNTSPGAGGGWST